MTNSIPLVSPYDVAIAWVAYADHPGVGKPRPIIVLKSDERVALVVAAKVTSHAPRPEVAGEVALLDWELEGLALPSTARCSQVVEVRLGDIGKVVGSLTQRDRERLVEGLREASEALPAS